MRLLTLFFFLLLTSCARFTPIEGTYFSNQQDALVLDGNYSAIESKPVGIIDEMSLKQTDSKLKFLYKTGRFLFITRGYRYNFRIDYKAVDSFIVSPKSRLAKTYFQGRDSIVFKTKYAFADRETSFTKIIFHSSHCFGCCKDLHLELDYSGNLKVTDNGSGWVRGCRDSLLNDNYFGKVSYDDMERLRNILTFAQLKTLEWPGRSCFDAPDKTLIIYQNEKRYYFKLNAPCIPIVSRPLTGFLNRLFTYQTLKKVDTTFSYER